MAEINLIDIVNNSPPSPESLEKEARIRLAISERRRLKVLEYATSTNNPPNSFPDRK